jgi:glycosyltransferase involved in cell wall biosynthesis
MSILWIYDKAIDPQAGGTERATHLVMQALTERGYLTSGYLVFSQDPPREIRDRNGFRVDDLHCFLKENNIQVVINQIGYSKWLLEEFLDRGGRRWKDEGGRILTKLHFDPLMFSTQLKELTRHWHSRSLIQKVRRLGRIVLLPVERLKSASTLRDAYAYLIEQSDNFIILSEKHRLKLCQISRTKYPDRIHVIPNPNTFAVPFTHERLKQKKNTVLIVSRLDEPQKRISLALMAWRYVMLVGGLSDWTLKIVGEGNYGDDYSELVKKKNIQNVQFIGHSDPEAFYEEASLYLHSAKREGWGLTITEAMQKGVVPIVMNSSPVFEELIMHNESGILSKDGDVKLFALHIIELMNNRNKREKMAVRSIETTQKNEIELIVKKWCAVIMNFNLNTHTNDL